MKTCSKCKTDKDENSFRPLKHSKDGLNAWCKSCFNEYQMERYNNDKDFKNNRQKISYKNSLKRFNMTLEDYDVMSEEQGNVCAICGGINENGRRLSVDHDHSTGEVRELLCAVCNTGLGSFNDDINLFLSAIQYIQKHNGQKLQIYK